MGNVKTLLSTGPYSESDMQGWDDALLAACPSYPNMRVFNWAAMAQPQWFISDGIHYTSAGWAARSAAIADACRPRPSRRGPVRAPPGLPHQARDHNHRATVLELRHQRELVLAPAGVPVLEAVAKPLVYGRHHTRPSPTGPDGTQARPFLSSHLAALLAGRPLESTERRTSSSSVDQLLTETAARPAVPARARHPGRAVGDAAARSPRGCARRPERDADLGVVTSLRTSRALDLGDALGDRARHGGRAPSTRSATPSRPSERSAAHTGTPAGPPGQLRRPSRTGRPGRLRRRSVARPAPRTRPASRPGPRRWRRRSRRGR